MQKIVKIALSLVLLCASSAWAQGVPIGALPSATLPLSGNELEIVQQNGVTSKATVANVNVAGIVMPSNTLLGNNTGGSLPGFALTTTQVDTLLGLGTAAFQATGTSGATLPFLNGTNTWSAGQTFNGTIAGSGFTNLFASPPPIGSTVASTGAFTTLSASSTVSGTGFSTYLASPPAIGGSAAAAGSFTTLSASSTVSGAGFSTYLASPPAIGGSAAAAGSFTTLAASSTVSGTGFSTYLASPPAIGSSAASTGRFTTVTATTGAIVPHYPNGVTGDVSGADASAGAVGEYVNVTCPNATGINITFSNASPTVANFTNMSSTPSRTGSYAAACPFVITANPPTGLSSNVVYYATNFGVGGAGTFNVSTTAALALAGTYANTTGTTTTASVTGAANVVTATGISVAAIQLPAGDFDCEGSVTYLPAASTSVTNMAQGIWVTDNTVPSNPTTFTDLETAANVMTATNTPILAFNSSRWSSSSTTKLYVVTKPTFTVSTMQADGYISCRRAH